MALLSEEESDESFNLLSFDLSFLFLALSYSINYSVFEPFDLTFISFFSFLISFEASIFLLFLVAGALESDSLEASELESESLPLLDELCLDSSFILTSSALFLSSSLSLSDPDDELLLDLPLLPLEELLLDDDSVSAKYIKKDFVEKIVNEHLNKGKNHRLLIWSFLNFEWWCRIFLMGADVK